MIWLNLALLFKPWLFGMGLRQIVGSQTWLPISDMLHKLTFAWGDVDGSILGVVGISLSRNADYLVCKIICLVG